jgi:hypothetical protein
VDADEHLVDDRAEHGAHVGTDYRNPEVEVVLAGRKGDD